MAGARPRAIVVTGASAGIGRALAREAVRHNFSVLAVARRADRLEELKEHICQDNGLCATLAIDVTAAGAPDRIVAAALEAFGHIDAVVNNAGSGAYGPLLEQTDAQIEAQWQLHVAAPLRIARAALPHLRASRGTLVFVGSGIARVPIPNYGAYAPAKAAVRTAATQLRRELKADGIAVTYVDPGLVATEFHDAAGIERRREIPPATPEQIARAIVRGIRRRAHVVHGTPWQSLGTVIGEWSSTLADKTLIGMAPKPLGVTPSEVEGHVVTPSDTVVTPSEVEGRPPDPSTPPPTFEKALERVARRMERVKLSPTFMREVLVPGATVELNDVAMRWAGMPNKNERAAMHEVLDTLAASGYLEPMGVETWKVLRAAD